MIESRLAHARSSSREPNPLARRRSPNSRRGHRSATSFIQHYRPTTPTLKRGPHATTGAGGATLQDEEAPKQARSRLCVCKVTRGDDKRRTLDSCYIMNPDKRPEGWGEPRPGNAKLHLTLFKKEPDLRKTHKAGLTNWSASSPGPIKPQVTPTYTPPRDRIAGGTHQKRTNGR